MKILFLSDNFPPEGNAPASRTFEHCREWVRQGAEVTVITCAPNFPEGKVYPGYRNAWYSKEFMDGIKVVRVKTFMAPNKGFALRILDFLSFMFSAFFAGMLESRPDIVAATSPQFFAAVGGWFLAAVRRVPFVFEVRDLWPASVVHVQAMKRGRVLSVLEKLELFLYRRAALIVVVTPAFQENLVQRGIAPEKIKVVTNGVDLARFSGHSEPDTELVSRYSTAGKFVVGYLGTMGMAHNLENVLKAAEILSRHPGIVFLFVGGGAEKTRLEAQAREAGLDNVIFVPRCPKEMMPRFWSLCDLSLVHLKNVPLFETVIPSKIFESMGMGIPLLVCGPKGEAWRVVEKAGAGVYVPPDDPSALAESILRMEHDPAGTKKAAQSAVHAAPGYDRCVLARKMLSYLKDVKRSGRS